jgi:hypothetical protein
MARAVALSVSVEIVDIESGLWCATCNLSTGVSALYTMTINGATSLHTTARCHECHGRDVEAT